MTKKERKYNDWWLFINQPLLVDRYEEGTMPTEDEIKQYEEANKKQELEFLTKQQQDILLYAEEAKKIRQWLEDHWVCVEGGDGYYDWTTNE